MTNIKNSIIEKFQKNINKCDICYSSYDRKLHQPVIICSMHHTICKDCMKSLQRTRQCPFCREAIKFDKIVINNYIYELLPSEQVSANIRAETNNHQISYQRQSVSRPQDFRSSNQQSLTYPSIPQSFAYVPAAGNPYIPLPQQNEVPNPPSSDPPVSINNQNLQRVYSDNFRPPADQLDLSRALLPDRSPQQVAWDLVKDYFWSYVCLLPFTIINLTIATANTNSTCLDVANGSSVWTLRPWLLSIGIIEITILLLQGIVILLFCNNCIKPSKAKAFSTAIMFIALTKLFVWMVAELVLFIKCISPSCSGGVYAYGLILLILHSLLFIPCCCFSCLFLIRK